MTIKNGPSASSPSFSGATNLTGSLNLGSYTSTDPTGAITIIFTSDSGYTEAGWVANFSCNTLSLSDVNKDNSVLLSPNPVKSNFKIDRSDKIESVTVFDNSGKLIKTFDSDSVSKNNYDVSKLKTGNYVIQIKTEKEILSKKLIKE